jgi:hypothetical protein
MYLVGYTLYLLQLIARHIAYGRGGEHPVYLERIPALIPIIYRANDIIMAVQAYIMVHVRNTHMPAISGGQYLVGDKADDIVQSR